MKHARTHALAGSYYPDHVIFLGPGAAEPMSRRHDQNLILEPGAGAYLPEDALAAADELALCLTLVLARVPEGAELIRFTPAQEAALLGWDAEQYRQSLVRQDVEKPTV